MGADLDPPLVRRAREILEAARARDLDVRLIGGVAIYLGASEPARRLLGRNYGDIDLVARRKQSRDLRRLLEELGYEGQQPFNATHGDRRLLYHHADPEHRVDVFLEIFEMCHTIDLGPRLTVDSETLSSADLIITKLQIAQINAKDLSDCLLILLDHAPAARDGEALLNTSRVAELCGADWGLYTTLTDNLRHLANYVGSVRLSEGERLSVHERIGQVLDAIERTPKTLRWKARARVGRRVQWHDTPDEIA
jgi:hypothetical protein